MLFNSYEFVLIFLPLCVVGYYAIINRYKNNKQGLVLLLLFSLVYIGYTNILYLLIFIPNMVICYWICRYMNNGRMSQVKRKSLLISGIVIEVLIQDSVSICPLLILFFPWVYPSTHSSR